MEYIKEKIAEKVKGIIDYPLTILTAPIGYGKTTVIRNFLETYKGKVEWYDEKQEVWKGDACYKEQTIVVLDNYHKILEKGEEYKKLVQMVEEKREGLHIVLITKERPDMPIEELCIKGLCQFIEERDLRFDTDKIEAYFKAHNITLKKEEFEKIEKYIEGWPAMVYLMKENFLNYKSVYPTYTLYKFLKEGIYENYEESYRKLFILVAAIDEFEMKDFMILEHYPQIVEGINKLLKDNIIKYIPERQTYSLNNIFKNFLKEEIELHDPKIYKETCSYIGKWYLLKEEWNQAVEYLVKAEEYGEVLKKLNESERQESLNISSVVAAKLLENIDERVWKNYPLSYLKLTYYKLLGQEKQKVREELEKLENMIKEDKLDIQGIEERIIGEINAIKGIVVWESIEELKQRLETTVRHIPAGSILIKTTDRIRHSDIHLSYGCHTEIGKYKENISQMKTLLHEYGEIEIGDRIETQYLLSAEYYMYRGEWEDATNCSLKLFYKSDMTQNRYTRLIAQLILARIAIGQGKYKEAFEGLEEIKEYKGYLETEELRRIKAVCIGYIQNCLANLVEQDRELRYVTNEEEPTLQEGISSYMMQAEKYLQWGEYLRADILGDMIKEKMFEENKVFGQLYFHLFKALTYHKMNKLKEAQQHLYKALKIAKPDQIILPFKEHIEQVKSILKGMVFEEAMRSYIQTVAKTEELEMNKKQNNRPFMRSQWGLTERECEIIDLIKQGLTNKQIAEKLFVANVTIAKTTSNIYRKMGVGSRIEMIGKIR